MLFKGGSCRWLVAGGPPGGKGGGYFVVMVLLRSVLCSASVKERLSFSPVQLFDTCTDLLAVSAPPTNLITQLKVKLPPQACRGNS